MSSFFAVMLLAIVLIIIFRVLWPLVVLAVFFSIVMYLIRKPVEREQHYYQSSQKNQDVKRNASAIDVEFKEREVKNED